MKKKNKKKTREFSAGGLKSELSKASSDSVSQRWQTEMQERTGKKQHAIAPCSTKAVRDPRIKKVSAVKVRDKGCKIKAPRLHIS